MNRPGQNHDFPQIIVQNDHSSCEAIAEFFIKFYQLLISPTVKEICKFFAV